MSYYTDPVRVCTQNLEGNVEEKHKSAQSAIIAEAFAKECTPAQASQWVYEAKKEMCLPWTIGFGLYTNQNGLQISFRGTRTYEEILQMESAMLSYSGKYISAQESREFPWGRATVRYEVKLPEDERYLLVKIGKIAYRTETEEYTTC